MKQDIDMQNGRESGSAYRHPGLILACALVLLLAACGKPKQTTEVKVTPPEVMVAEVIQQTIPVTMDFSATVKAVKKVKIIPRVSGYIVERHFQEGDYVHQGDPLYLIDPKPYQAHLEAAQAKLDRDRANLKRWKSEAARYTRLAKQGAGSVEDKERAIARLAEAKATILQDQADIDNAELELGYTRITAPLTGRIEQTRINVGQLVEEQKDVLTTLVQMDPIYVLFNLSRAQSFEAQKLRRKGLGMAKLEEYKAHILLPDGSPYPDEGALDYLSAQVDPKTDTFAARALFPNQITDGRDADLMPGQYTPLTLVVGRHPDTLLIPQPALIQSQAGTHVYIVGDGSKVEHRSVTVDGAYQHQWIITKGLKKGEKVIVQGVQKVKHGMTVKIVTKGSADSVTNPSDKTPSSDKTHAAS